MEQLYIKELKISKVRHLNNVTIPVTEDGLKHLIFTGKNGSGKNQCSGCDGRLFEINCAFIRRDYGDEEKHLRSCRRLTKNVQLYC